MLPSRPRLERWNPDSLPPAGKSIAAGGITVGEAVTRINNNLKTMPETKTWSGGAHDAATSMFDRAKKQTDNFSKYTKAVGDALSSSADPIGSAQRALLNKADTIDAGGKLKVTDQWVVLMLGGQMSLEQAAALEKQAQSEQLAVNNLLIAVGSADDAAATKIMAAAKPYGFEMPAPSSPLNLGTGAPHEPVDEVPNPLMPMGVTQQALLRDSDMSQTIRETTVEKNYDPTTGKEVSTTTTIYMLDGSKHVKKVDSEPTFSDRGPLTFEVHYDKNGKEMSRTSSATFNEYANHSQAGKTFSTTQYADGTVVELTQSPDGKQMCTVIRGSFRKEVPMNLIDHPILTPLGATGKYFGPGVSIATALWDVSVAQTDFEKCVAKVEGVTSVAAGTIAGIATWEATPLVSVPVGILAASGGEALGNWIGNTYCPQ